MKPIMMVELGRSLSDDLVATIEKRPDVPHDAAKLEYDRYAEPGLWTQCNA